MSATVSLRIKINYPVVLFIVLLVHILFLLVSDMNPFKIVNSDPPTVLKIRQVKSARLNHPTIKSMSSVLNKSEPGLAAPTPLKSLKELQAISQPRPGTRPEPFKKPRTLNSMSLNGSDFKKSFPSTAISSKNLSSGGNKVSDAVVSIEVPDGTPPDELNKYELMYYGFQKRTAIAYANSILSNLDKFNRRYPHFKMKDQPNITMTARMTYDEKGNVKQIKMIRWTHVNELQDFFEDVMKSMDQLHNPPKSLWETQGEFSMFFTLEIING